MSKTGDRVREFILDGHTDISIGDAWLIFTFLAFFSLIGLGLVIALLVLIIHFPVVAGIIILVLGTIVGLGCWFVKFIRKGLE